MSAASSELGLDSTNSVVQAGGGRGHTSRFTVRDRCGMGGGRIHRLIDRGGQVWGAGAGLGVGNKAPHYVLRITLFVEAMIRSIAQPPLP